MVDAPPYLVKKVREILGKAPQPPGTVAEALLYIGGHDPYGVGAYSYRGCIVPQLQAAIREVMEEACHNVDT